MFPFVFLFLLTMATIIPVPSLSLDGWLTNTAKMADKMFAHFFAAEYSQTHFFVGEVSSLPWILQEYQGDMNTTATRTRETLERYFGNYFDNVEVEVLWKEEPTDSASVALTIYVGFTDKIGKQFSLAKVATLLDSIVVKVIDINNNGASDT